MVIYTHTLLGCEKKNYKVSFKGTVKHASRWWMVMITNKLNVHLCISRISKVIITSSYLDYEPGNNDVYQALKYWMG